MVWSKMTADKRSWAGLISFCLLVGGLAGWKFWFVLALLFPCVLFLVLVLVLLFIVLLAVFVITFREVT